MSSDRDPRIPDIEGDIAGHDLGRAKERLCSFLNNEGYDPGLCAEIGHLCRKMRDPREAGRWLFISDDDSTEADYFIEMFLNQHKRKPSQIVAQLPRRAKLADESEYPEVVRARFEKLSLVKPLGEYRRFRPRTKLQRVRDDAARLVGSLILLAIVATFLVGLVQIAIWIWSLVFS